MTATIDLHAERELLGACLADADSFAIAEGLLTADDFADTRHALCWAALGSLYREGLPVDTLALRARLEATGRLERVGDEALLALSDSLPDHTRLEARARHLRDLSAARAVVRAARLVLAEADAPVDDWRAFVDRAEMAVAEAARQRSAIQEPTRLGVAVESEIRRWNERRMLPGHPTGFRDLDRVLGGLVPGTVCIVAARPGVGKSAFALQAACTTAGKAGQAVLVQSLEMPLSQVAQRSIAQESGIDLSKMRDLRFNRDDMTAAMQAGDRLDRVAVYIDDTARCSITDIRRNARKLARSKDGLCLIVVDYLQLMRPLHRGRSREEEVSEISRDLLLLAKELKVPVLALSQLNRDSTKRSGKAQRPQLSDLRESGSLEQDAYAVVFLYRDDMVNPESLDKGIAEAIVGKNRNGPTGTVRLAYRREMTRFENLADDDPRINEPPPPVERNPRPWHD